MAQKRDGHDRVLSDPWCIWFSVRVPPQLGSDIWISTGPLHCRKAQGRWERGGGYGWQDWNLSGSLGVSPGGRQGPHWYSRRRQVPLVHQGCLEILEAPKR